MKFISQLLILLLLSSIGLAQIKDSPDSIKTPYTIRLRYDIPITAIGIAGTAYGFKLRADKPMSDSLTIVNLNVNDLKKINRDVTTRYNETASKISDFMIAEGFVLPWFLAFDKKVRDNLGDVGLLYLQTMAITGLGYWGTAGLIDKYRPYAYNKNVDFDRRASKNAKNSFYGGHVSVTAAGSFFVAQVYSDLHPESNFKYALWSFAVAATGANMYLRYEGGFHFIDDLAIGAAIGTATGILVPVIHRKKRHNKNFSLLPFSNQGPGLTIQWHLK